MKLAAYDPEAVRLLSAVAIEALDFVQRAAAKPFTEEETAGLSKKIAGNLMRVFDLGERDPSALRRAALEGLSASPQPSLVMPGDGDVDRKPGLTAYRLYALDARNKVFGPPKYIEAVDDETAFKQAVPLLDGHALELWQEARFVVRLEPGAVPQDAFNSATKGDAANVSPDDT